MQLTRNLVVRSVLPIAVIGLVLTGCTTKTPGGATPTSGAATSTTETSDGGTTTSEPSGGGDLAAFDACKELNEVASKLSLSRIQKDVGTACQARFGQTTTIVTVKAFPQLGIADLSAGPKAQPSDIPVGAHKAKRVKTPLTDTDCVVSVEITAKSRVDFVAASTTSPDEACDAATQVATAVEPKLPK
ncbi:hypothetical protein ABZ816_12450 [Actinosynnema sp. NPDC047251]|uniref:hypothetical protein n=1 Tax=Saccharothrix espanaensis TaxID=103731 RepID=UPI0002F4F8A2|nr:hypothetical protein [Saccharothrix espanaensis]